MKNTRSKSYSQASFNNAQNIKPLIFYNRKKAKHSKIQEFLKEKSTKTQKLFSSIEDECIDKEAIPISQEKYISDIRQHVEKIIPSPMLKTWESKVLSLIPKKFKKNYVSTLKLLIDECQTDWNDNLHNLIVKSIIRDEVNLNREHYKELSLRYGGRTENYERFLKTKTILREKLFIVHPFMRKVLDTSMIMFPNHLVNFSLFRKKGLITLENLFLLFTNELKNSEVQVENWYKQLISNFKLSWKDNLFVQKNKKGLISCMENAMIMQIEELMRRSIEHIIEVIENEKDVPFISMELKFDSDIYLDPSFDQILNVYKDMIQNICLICHKLPNFVSENNNLKSKYLHIEINEWVLENSISSINIKLNNIFSSVLTYVNGLKEEYTHLINDCLDVTRNKSREVIISYEKIFNYKLMSKNLLAIINSKYFSVGKLDQSHMISNLRKFSLNLQNDILDKMRITHQQQVYEICVEFKNIAARAQAIPKDATELMASGAYCSYVKTVLIDELQEKISKAISELSQLIEMATLSDDHIMLNTKMVNWLLYNIHPILDKNAMNYETLKYDMEESLMAKTNSLTKQITDLLPYLEILDEMDDMNNTFLYLEDIRKLVHKIRDCEDEVSWINKEETVFKFPVSQYSELEEIKDYVLPFYELMYLMHRWRRSYYSWMDGPFEYINCIQVEREHEEYCQEFSKIFKQYKNKIKQQISDGNERRFKGLVEDPDPMNLPAPMKLCAQALNGLKEWRPYVQLVNIMCNSALRQRHWDEMSQIAGFDLTPDAGTTIRKLIKLNLWEDLNKYEIISVGACNELALVTNLNNMISEWNNINFKLDTYKNTDIKVVTQLEDVQAMLEDHTVKTISMRGSAFVKPFEVKVKDWYNKLLRVNKTIDIWIKIQYQRINLLPFFTQENIMNQMPQETLMFQNVDNVYRQFIDLVESFALVVESASKIELVQSLESTEILLDTINNGVSDYIEKKRLYFSRFFFLSNNEILNILSKTENPFKVQPHLKKCFDGIDKLNIDPQLNILGVFSEKHEYVPFCNSICTKAAHGSVEKWLLNMEKEILYTIRDDIKKSFYDYTETSKEDWLSKWEEMVVLCVSQIYWTANVHSQLKTKDIRVLKDFYNLSIIQLNQLITFLQSSILKNNLRNTIRALIVIDIHAKDVIQELINSNIIDENCFNWLAQLRYYWEDNNVIVRIINASVQYGYEYLGNVERLVITPLTDRCYRTLIGAYDLNLNGAPEGPAGTGKTETVKDLAKALAKRCMVFNCSDGLDYKTMGRFFKGLASSGAWACFDEFNRIKVEVLSVVAQQILFIAHAVRKKDQEFHFEGTCLILNPTCFICITMNPGYAGRSELPDNLKVLFRTVAMMVPDYVMVGEISLFSYGYLDAKNLSQKIVTTYRLCSEQLSSQKHYDYGMRAVKTILLLCGENKIKCPTENENILLLRALTDVNLPKFVIQDIPLFKEIISDIFPGLVSPPSDNRDMMVPEIIKSCNKANLQATDHFISKVIETCQLMNARHGFMLIGNPLTGKTSVLKILADVSYSLKNLNLGFDFIEYNVINPKSLEPYQLFGMYNTISNEWIDGIVGNIFREYAKNNGSHRKWIIFDGPIDAIWIENMNTVLDDNRKLCLNSGEIISLPKSISVIFEVMDVSQASPATISRCGMIYFQPNSIGFNAFAKSWINHHCSNWKDGYEEYIIDLCNWMFPPLLKYMQNVEKSEIAGGEMSLVVTSLKLVNMLMSDAISVEEETKYLKTWIQASFIFSIVWGLSGNLNIDAKKKFDEYFRDFCKNDKTLPENLEKLDVSIPMEGLLSEYIYQYKQKGNWKHWQEVVKTVKIIETTNISQMLIPTVDTVKYLFLLDLHIRYNVPMLLSGATGTGKTFYFQKFILNQLSSGKYSAILLKFTSTSSAKSTQNLILSKLYKQRNNSYGPAAGKSALIFIDDMNMPEKEIYGAQSAIEILRQLLDHKFWYNPQKISILKSIVYGNVGPVGGSRHCINPRFLRHFSIFSIDDFSIDSTTKIFTNILQIGWKRSGFGNDVIPLINNIVSASIDVYEFIRKQLLPSMKKPHYIFNVRDISRVIQGCLLMKKEIAENKKIFVKLWIHEISRTFYDRLICNYERECFFELIKKCVTTHFKENLEDVCDSYLDDEGRITKELLKKLIFGTYLDNDSPEEDKKYEEVPNLELLYKKATDALEEHNSVNKIKMNLILFQYALEHLSKICRVFSIPEGSVLLIGISGSGRQSIVKLASTMMGKILFQPEISSNYNTKSWHNDMKYVLKESGGFLKEIVLLMSDEQIIDESFLEDIDGLLNSGDIPDIFEIEEKQDILELVRLDAQGGNRNMDISALQVLEFFKTRCKDKLHICLCMSPIGNSFRNRLRLYPSLINCCTIDWFDSWPEDALEKIAYHYIENINLSNDIQEASIKVCKYFHSDAHRISNKNFEITKNHIYMTSASFLDLINLFVKLIKDKQNELFMTKQRFLNGLEKLNMAALAVTNMQKELNELKPQLIIMAVRGAEMMEEIERETIEADKATIQVREDEKIANEQAAAAQILKKDCEADLALAIPILEDAIEALNTLKPTDITLVKSMKNPPAAIKLVMAAVCVMKSISADRIPDPSNPGRKMMDYWGPSKRLLGDMGFLQSLKEFDKDNIPVATMLKIRKEYLPHKDFKPHIIAKASTAAEGLCKWVIAMDMYDAVAKVVAPKKAKLQAAEDEFAATMAILDEKKAMVARLEKKVADLHLALEEANLKKQLLEEEVELCINKLHRAEKLIGGLGGEKSRWTKAAENLQLLYENLAGDIILSCGIIAYLAPFPNSERILAITNWKNYVLSLDIPLSNDYSLYKVLGMDADLQKWHIAGLPNDQISIDNAIIQSTSLRWSIFIDPQIQANKWVKILEKPNDLCVLKLSDKDYINTIGKCIELGIPVLIENISTELDASLDPILKKIIYVSDSKIFINIGKHIIEYNDKFRLYITTNYKNPHFYPEIYNKVTVINFSLSQEGLEDQFLGIVVAKERPDLQDKREKLIIESAENNAALKNIENSILKTLQESKGDILEDEAAIEVLDSSKSLSIEILKKRATMKEVEKMINEFRASYLPVAKHSAIIYYCITDLSNIDPMYQYSLTWFINLYKYSIETANKSKDHRKRLKFIMDTLTYNLYCNITRSLFEKDKLTFSFVLCTKILLTNGEIDKCQFEYFLSSDTHIKKKFEHLYDWLPKKAWDNICNIEVCPGFENFKFHFMENHIAWKYIYDSSEPHIEVFPIHNILSEFQKLIIIKILRPDKLIDAVTEFIKSNMGVKFVKPPPFDINKSFIDSNCLIPLIFILSPGADPIEALLKFSERMGFDKKLNYLSLGQGQGEKAISMIQQAQIAGRWVCLQNCHLATSWLLELERTYENINLTNTDVSFRLWLTSYPTDKFPRAILQSGIKMTNEPPTGLKNNLNRLYFSEPLKDPEFYEGCPGKHKEFSKLLYGICFFHAVIQERKKFGTLGWNIPYDFNDSDFQISTMQLKNFLCQYNDIPYSAISYLIGECNYGGRVTDDLDRKLIITILKNFINAYLIDDSKYKFYNENSIYGLPKRYEYQDYLKHIETIPQIVSPLIYGLHENASIGKNIADSENILNSFLTIHDKNIGINTVHNSEEILINICDDIIKKLPSEFNIDVVLHKYPPDYNESFNTFLVQEMERFNVLTKLIVSSLKTISKSVQGLILMSPRVETEANFILMGKVPQTWMKVSYPSLKPIASYISDLIQRLKMLETWFNEGKPLKFWISGFYFTQAFLTAGMQNFVRKQNVSIDLFTYDCEVINEIENIEINSLFLYIHGPFFDGVRWNNEKLVLDEQYSKILHECTPIIKIFFVKKTELNDERKYKCPIYKTLERRGILSTTGHSTNFVISLPLASDKPVDHWIKRSAAIVLQLND